MKTFDDVVEFLGTIPNIDEGGCAISALAMYRWLKKQGKRPSIMYFYGLYDGDFNINEHYKKGTGQTVCSCQHAMLRFRGKYYDATNDYPQRHTAQRHVVPEKMVVDSINKSMWNSNFERKHIKVIQKFVGVDLSDLKLKRVS